VKCGSVGKFVTLPYNAGSELEFVAQLRRFPAYCVPSRNVPRPQTTSTAANPKRKLCAATDPGYDDRLQEAISGIVSQNT
jgi:hypothetical protein